MKNELTVTAQIPGLDVTKKVRELANRMDIKGKIEIFISFNQDDPMARVVRSIREPDKECLLLSIVALNESDRKRAYQYSIENKHYKSDDDSDPDSFTLEHMRHFGNKTLLPYLKEIALSQEETDFLCAHELGHIKQDSNKNKLIIIGISSLAVSCFLIYRTLEYLDFNISDYPISWQLSFYCSAFCSALTLREAISQGIQTALLRIIEESEADNAAIQALNTAEGGIKLFKGAAEENKKVRLKSWKNWLFFTSKGNNLKDFRHPFLTTRIRAIKEVEENLKKTDDNPILNESKPIASYCNII